jgi:TetR/AcrR family transcriptional regulator, repressor of fatR-cypB operon
LTAGPRPVSVRSLTVQILKEKPGTKRPAIVAAATSLFAKLGVDATSMRDIADAAGVREAAIYRHFIGKEQMAQEIFASWYGWYGQQVRQIVEGKRPGRAKLRALVHLEFETARNHPQEFLYFCENEARFLATLPQALPRVRQELITMIREGQGHREVRGGDAGLLADLLSGALCAAAISAIRRRDLAVLDGEKLTAESCWQMLRPNR